MSVPYSSKVYAHRGKRRKKYTEELFRCQFVTLVGHQTLVCNCLLWKNRSDELRTHLLEHFPSYLVTSLTLQQLTKCYSNASSVWIDGMPRSIDDDSPDEFVDFPDDLPIKKENV